MPRQFHWEYHPGQKLSLVCEGETLATYSFSTTDSAKPFIHPLRTVAGVPLTAFQPSDHVWHRGLWFSWKFINGVNYWEEEAREVDGRVRSLSDGRTEVAENETVTFGPQQAEVTTWIDYVAPTGRKVLKERRLVRLCAPQSYGDYSIDWEHDFTVGDEAVTLSVTPVTPETPWGGYAGLGWRAARSLRDFRTINSNGSAGESTNGEAARWIDLSGVADGGKDIAAGLAILDHPSNPRHPAPSYVYFDTAQFGYINPSPIRDEPMRLAARARLRLRYRVIVHDGWPDPEAIERDFRAFASTR